MKSLLLVGMWVVLVVFAQVALTEELVDELTVNDEGDEIIVREARAAKNRGTKGKGTGKECRYTKAAWSECDSNTNQRTRTLTLKKGDKETCEQTRSETKKCKKMCRYVKGEWSACVASTNEMERIDNLKHGSDPSCEPTMKKKRKCKVCKYDRKAEWSPCDPKSGLRTRVQKLLEGDSAICSSTKTKSRPCKTQNGKDRCFYGPWSDWSQCQNGTQSKTRSVVSGGSRCHKKASKSRDCKGRQS